jgi:hypothetical protein
MASNRAERCTHSPPAPAIVAAGMVALSSGCAEVSTALVYGAYEAGDYNQTDFWCGNRARGGQSQTCASKATDDNGERPVRQVEVRGWVVSPPGYNEGENEWIFNLLLDHGWTQASPASEHAEPINTPELINAVITPHNVVSFGVGDGGAATAWLGDNAWGSASALTLHVEVNGWGRRSGTSDHRARAWPPPPGWTIAPRTAAENGHPGVAWSFDPFDPPAAPGVGGPLAAGDYVRMVGMLWEDAPHEDSDEGRSGDDADHTQDGKQCWKSGRHDRGGVGRGFSELHPVDYLAKLAAPRRTDRLYVVALCGDAANVARDVRPPDPRPPGATAAFEEFLDLEFTNLGSVTRHRVRPHDEHITIDVITRNRTNGTRGKFKAVYRVFWSTQP